MIDKLLAIDASADPIEGLPVGFDFNVASRFGRPGKEDDDERKSMATSFVETTAVVPIRGRLSKEVGIMRALGYGGPPTTSELEAEIHILAADPQVKKIVLAVDSPGGSVDGIRGLAEAIRAARGQKEVVAMVDGKAISAAYWIAAQASRIVATSGSAIGGIGAFTVLTDTEDADRQAGVKRVVVADGALKGLGADGKVTPELVEETSRLVLGIGKQFTEDVAEGRNVSAAKVSEWHGGRVWLASEAHSMGMVDSISSLREVLRAAQKQHAPEGGTPDMSDHNSSSVNAEEVSDLRTMVETLAGSMKTFVDSQQADIEARKANEAKASAESREQNIQAVLGALVTASCISGEERDTYKGILASLPDKEAQALVATLAKRRPNGMTASATPPTETTATALIRRGARCPLRPSTASARLSTLWVARPHRRSPLPAAMPRPASRRTRSLSAPRPHPLSLRPGSDPTRGAHTRCQSSFRPVSTRIHPTPWQARSLPTAACCPGSTSSTK